jgi:parallel beta-helix repeat protein
LYGEVVSSAISNDGGKDEVPEGNFTLKGVTVTDNKITMNNSYGIWLQSSDSCVVSGNTVTMNVGAGVSGSGNCDPIRLVKSKDNSLINNTLEIKKKNKKTQKACGIVITTKSSATLTGNTIKNALKDGIFVVTKSSAVVKSNKIIKTGRYGLNVCEKSTARSIKNTFKKCKKRQYNVYDKSKIKKK